MNRSMFFSPNRMVWAFLFVSRYRWEEPDVQVEGFLEQKNGETSPMPSPTPRPGTAFLEEEVAIYVPRIAVL